jgi:hypothetical protein
MSRISLLPSVLALTFGLGCSDPGSKRYVLLDSFDASPEVSDVSIDYDIADAESPDAASACDPNVPCTDRNPCTVDDRCVEGVCVGDPLECDDDITCTLDQCVGGVCRHEVAPGFCRLDGKCFDQGQPNPTNPCERCDSTASRGSWTSMDGLKCQDGDACTEGETCLEGECQGGVRLETTSCELPDPTDPTDPPDPTDPTDPPDPAPTTCATHFDCYPEKVCARSSIDNSLRCAVPCGSSSECLADETCVKLPGSANIGYCDITTGLGEGEICSTDSQCESRLCAAGKCRAFCLDEGGCTTPQYTCRAIGALGDGTTTSACVPDDNKKVLGQACTPDGYDFNANYCASSHCDLVPYGTVGPQALLPCAPLCQREQDCGYNQECGVVIYGEFPDPNSTPFHPQNMSAPRSAITACYSRNGAVSSFQPGTPCASPTQCSSNKCLHLIPNDAQRYCSGYCATDADCPSNMQCKPDLITLASDWLQTSWITTQGPSLQQQTLVRVCKFR